MQVETSKFLIYSLNGQIPTKLCLSVERSFWHLIDELTHQMMRAKGIRMQLQRECGN